MLLYEGTAEADQEGNIVVAPQGKIELSAEDGELCRSTTAEKRSTYYLAWEHEDLLRLDPVKPLPGCATAEGL